MNHCAKCGAELIGSKKFCTACGTPATSPRATTNVVPSAITPGATGDKAVDPLASTAMPRPERGADYGPPPAPQRASAQPPPGPLSSALVSPLAVSNVVSQRNAFADAAISKPSSVPPAADALASTVPSVDRSEKARIPGTELMPSVPHPSMPANASTSPEPPKPRPNDRTQMMSAFARPPSIKPQAPAPQTYSAPAPAPAAYGGYPAPPYGFPPGSRVHVTWSDGRKYPGTVHQMSGTQHLIVFPDGQQHWVDLPYLSPG